MAAKPSGRTPELPKPQGVSLHELTQAFAEAMGTPAANLEPAGEAAAESPLSGTPAEADPVEPAEPAPATIRIDTAMVDEAADTCPIGPETILEAMLFVGNRSGQPLEARQAADLMRGVESGEVPELVENLNRRYAVRGCPYEIISEGPGYRMTLRKRHQGLRERFYGRVRETRLSQVAIDLLAIVAYQQPISGEKIDQLRGKESSRILHQMVRRGLLQVERPDKQKRIIYYRTARRFLDLFGLDSLADLPQSEDPD